MDKFKEQMSKLVESISSYSRDGDLDQFFF